MKLLKKKFQVSRDGKTIHGIEYRPEGENLPIAIVSHGFLATYGTTKHYARWFAQQGYAAYCFDFIGGGVGCHSDGKLRDMTVLTEKADLHAVIRHVSALPYTNDDSLTLMGCSQGGFVSAMVAAELQEKVSRLILLYPALCIPDDARAGKMMVFKFDPKNIPDRLSFGPLVLSGDYARAVVDMDPYEEIKSYSGPVLLIHGEKDPIVNISYAHRAKEAYTDSCTLHILPNAGHGFRKTDDQAAFAIMEQFLRNSANPEK